MGGSLGSILLHGTRRATSRRVTLFSPSRNIPKVVKTLLPPGVWSSPILSTNLTSIFGMRSLLLRSSQQSMFLESVSERLEGYQGRTGRVLAFIGSGSLVYIIGRWLTSMGVWRSLSLR